MRQIPLDLNAAEPASFDNYVAGSNREALDALRALAAAQSAAAIAREPERERKSGPEPGPAAGEGTPPLEAPRSIYLWGEPGAGKTHLLDALAGALGDRAIRLGPGSGAEDFTRAIGALDGRGPGRVAIVDDCDRLDADRQQAAFHLYNRAQADGRSAFVAAGAQPPLQLQLRDDLRTRLGWGVVLRLALLTDDEKADALRRAARGRGLALPDELIRYLLTHRSRDIRWLLRLLDALDRFALERKRAITLPLLRELENAEPLVKSH